MRTRIRIVVLTIVLLALLAMSVNGGTLISLWFQTDVHGRPCEIHIYQQETTRIDPGADAPCYELEWIIEVEELDDALPTITPGPSITPTVNPTVSPSITPTLEPYTGQYASLKTSSVYHKVTCSYLAGKDPSELEYYATCEIAQASGKRACSRCKPCPE